METPKIFVPFREHIDNPKDSLIAEIRFAKNPDSLRANPSIVTVIEWGLEGQSADFSFILLAKC